MISQWDIWFADFPFEDMEGSKDRPVIVLNQRLNQNYLWVKRSIRHRYENKMK